MPASSTSRMLLILPGSRADCRASRGRMLVEILQTCVPRFLPQALARGLARTSVARIVPY